MKLTGLWRDPTAQTPHPMQPNPKAGLTPIGREHLIRQHIAEDKSLAQVAVDHGSSLRTARMCPARKYLARFHSGGLQQTCL
jgi:hypothetical protein